MTNKPTIVDFLREMTVNNIIAKDDTLDEMIRDMKVFLARGGYGITNDDFGIILDHIDMLAYGADNPVEQIAQAQNLFEQYQHFAIRNEKQENER